MKIINYKSADFEKEIKRIIGRGDADISEIESSVKKIIQDVRSKGDDAVIEYTKRFDGISLKASELSIKKKEIKDAYSKTTKKNIESLQVCCRED